MDKGDLAPDFTLPDDQGEPRSLHDFLSAGPVVLFFYPAALSPGCTMESCHFRDLAKEFAEVGAQRVGISPDEVDRQHKFSARHGFDYPLLSDPDGTVARQFGVWRGIKPMLARRHTFVIGSDSRVLEVIKSEWRTSMHADKALETLRALHT